MSFEDFISNINEEDLKRLNEEFYRRKNRVPTYSYSKIKDSDTIDITYNGKTMRKTFKIDPTIRGTIALYPTFDDGINDDLIPVGYRFKQVQIKKVEV